MINGNEIPKKPVTTPEMIAAEKEQMEITANANAMIEFLKGTCKHPMKAVYALGQAMNEALNNVFYDAPKEDITTYMDEFKKWVLETFDLNALPETREEIKKAKTRKLIISK